MSNKIEVDSYYDRGFTLDEGLEIAHEVVEYLESLGVVAASGSHLEHDYLLLADEIERWKKGEIGNWSITAKEVFYGFIELHDWIWSVKSHSDFEKIIPHLKMLSESSIRLNAESPMINPVSGKQDDKSNKFIETMLGLYALKVGSDVELDDPYNSSGGKNPDILFTYDQRRVAIACKTPRSANFESLLSNVNSAKKQIERAECDIGFVAINAMNIFPHKETNQYVYNSLQYVAVEMSRSVCRLYRYDSKAARQLWGEIFANSKMSCTVVTLINSITQAKGEELGTHTDNSMKRICRHTFSEKHPEKWFDELTDNINYFLQGKELYI